MTKSKIMPKNDLKPIAIVMVITLVFFCICYFFYTNEHTSSKSFVCEGTYIGENYYTMRGLGGSSTYIVLFFKLDSGQEVKFKKSPFLSAVTRGERVKIYCHKGLFYNTFYDRYEPLTNKFRSWTERELLVPELRGHNT